MPVPQEFEPYVRAWKKRLVARRLERADLARRAREDAVAIAKMLVDRFGVDAVYLIGSVLDEERFDESSDIDIAVAGLDPRCYWDAIGAIEEMTQFSFDLIDLQSAGKSLIDKVQKDGVVLYDHGQRREKAAQP